jgi:serine/threonine protein kinase
MWHNLGFDVRWQGLQYLHHECSPQILHRDIKANNILVDLEYEAHLADFGIAKMVESATSHELSTVVGSLGYIPPGEVLQISIYPIEC